MKKLLALLLCLILCLSLFACNASEEPTEAPTETERAAKTEQGQSLLEYYSAFDIDAQDVRELILDAEDIRSYPYYDKDTLEPDGRLVFAVYDGGTVSNVFVADPVRRAVTHEDDENNRIILRMNDCIQKLPQFIIEGFIEPNSMFSFFGRCGVGEPLKLCMQGCCSLFDFLGVANEF